MLQRGLNAPITSSAGRLFDGIAALIGLRQHVSFEGQAAMELEWIADPAVVDAYPLDLLPPPRPDGAALLDWHPLVAAVLGDLTEATQQAKALSRDVDNAIAAAGEIKAAMQ